jgi:MFS family permease
MGSFSDCPQLSKIWFVPFHSHSHSHERRRKPCEHGISETNSRQGYTARIAQLLTVPPYATACVLTIIVAHFSDKYKKRGVFIIGSLTASAIGFILAIATSNRPDLSGVTYAGCFIACCGFYPAFPGVIAWLANNLAGSYKRAVGMGLQICKCIPLISISFPPTYLQHYFILGEGKLLTSWK